MEFNPLDIISVIFFFISWISYTVYTRRVAKKRDSLSSVLYRFRKEWVQKLSENGMSEVDAEMLATLERQVSFFASTSLLILATLVTVLGTSSDAFVNISSSSFIVNASKEMIQLKLLLLIFIFTYAFFTFTWSIRQYGFCFTIFGSTFRTVKYYQDHDNAKRVHNEQRDLVHLAKLLDRAGHSYNYGLRAYYFALAAMTWFIHPAFFIFSLALTVIVLYRREFKSSALQAMVDCRRAIKTTEQ